MSVLRTTTSLPTSRKIAVVALRLLCAGSCNTHPSRLDTLSLWGRQPSFKSLLPCYGRQIEAPDGLRWRVASGLSDECNCRRPISACWALHEPRQRWRSVRYPSHGPIRWVTNVKGQVANSCSTFGSEAPQQLRAKKAHLGSPDAPLHCNMEDSCPDRDCYGVPRQLGANDSSPCAYCSLLAQPLLPTAGANDSVKGITDAKHPTESAPNYGRGITAPSRTAYSRASRNS